MKIQFAVLGLPIPKGSKVAYKNEHMERAVIVETNRAKQKPWLDAVRVIAQQHAPAGGPWDHALKLSLVFTMPRPENIPKRFLYHGKKPDIDKLTRAIMDVLKSVLYRDDSLVSRLEVGKLYGTAPGVAIVLEVLEERKPFVSRARPAPRGESRAEFMS